MGCLLQGSSGLRNQTWVSCIAGRFFTICARSIIIKKLGICFQYWNFCTSDSTALTGYPQYLQYLQNNLFPIMLNNWSFETITKYVSECMLLSPVWLFATLYSLGQNTGVGNLSLLQGIFPTQGSNPGLLHCRWILYQLSHKGSPRKLEWVAYPFCSRSSWPRNQNRVSCIAGGFFTNWAIREALHMEMFSVNMTLSPFWIHKQVCV